MFDANTILYISIWIIWGAFHLLLHDYCENTSSQSPNIPGLTRQRSCMDCIWSISSFFIIIIFLFIGWINHTSRVWMVAFMNGLHLVHFLLLFFIGWINHTTWVWMVYFLFKDEVQVLWWCVIRTTWIICRFCYQNFPQIKYVTWWMVMPFDWNCTS